MLKGWIIIAGKTKWCVVLVVLFVSLNGTWDLGGINGPSS